MKCRNPSVLLKTYTLSLSALATRRCWKFTDVLGCIAAHQKDAYSSSHFRSLLRAGSRATLTTSHAPPRSPAPTTNPILASKSCSTSKSSPQSSLKLHVLCHDPTNLRTQSLRVLTARNSNCPPIFLLTNFCILETLIRLAHPVTRECKTFLVGYSEYLKYLSSRQLILLILLYWPTTTNFDGPQPTKHFYLMMCSISPP